MVYKNSILDCSSRDMHTMSVDFLNLVQAPVKNCNMIINGFVSKAWGIKLPLKPIDSSYLDFRKDRFG